MLWMMAEVLDRLTEGTEDPYIIAAKEKLAQIKAL